MVTRADIEALAARIAAEFRPERIVLFGSHATGSAGPDSDVDLLVVMPFEGSAVWAAAAILSQARPGFPVDLLLHTPEDEAFRLHHGDPVLKDAKEKGVLLYGRAA